MRKTKLFLLMAAMLLCCVGASADNIASGICGNNLTWELTDAGELIIEGTGDMSDYSSEEAPWYGYHFSVKTITIKEGATRIGNSAFFWCNSITNITLPKSVTSIGNWAFSDCYDLASITIPENSQLTSIGKFAFFGCRFLTSIIIPESVTSIGARAFSGCSSLTSITCNAVTPPTIGDSETFFNVDKSIPLYVPAGSVNTYKAADYWKEFTNIQTIPTNDIASGTCGDNLTWELTDEYELVIEGTGAMYDYDINGGDVPWYEYRESIKEITMEEGITSIGKSAFSGCSSLTAVTIPTSVTSIGEDAFDKCRHSLTSIVVAEGNTVYDSRNNCNAIIVTSSNTLKIGCKSTVIPEGVTSIGEEAFYECNSLTSIAIPEGVTSIGDRAFYECNNLVSITIPEGMKEIGYMAFGVCNLIRITIPSSISTIGIGAFGNNPNLEEIVVNQGNACYDSRNNCNAIIETNSNTLMAGCASTLIPEGVTAIGDYAFVFCSSTSIAIPEGVTTIGEWAFCCCRNLTSIVLPGSLTSIGHNAFYDCSSLTSINLPESVTSIGWYAFTGCSSLTSISIPENVAEIGHGAFIACNNLTSITCHAVMPPTIYSATFSGVSKSIPVYVPAGSVEAYQSAAYWSEFTNILALPTYVDGIALSQSEAMLTEGETVTLTATAMPDDATDKTLIWSSSDERVATVDAAGLVTALAPGTATITVAANDGSGVSASCVVTVKAKPTVRCAAPVIDYVDGQVVLTCETEGVEFVTDVVAEGAQRYQISTFDLAAVYTITAYATKEGYADSETTTVTLCWVECNEKHEDLDEPNTKIEIPSCPVLILTDGGVITLTGLADGTAVAVCNLKGVELGTAIAVNGTATITTGLTVGNTVIVKIGGRSVKVVIHE